MNSRKMGPVTFFLFNAALSLPPLRDSSTETDVLGTKSQQRSHRMLMDSTQWPIPTLSEYDPTFYR